jgi:hypothetical protein
MNLRETPILEIENSTLLRDSSELDELLAKKVDSGHVLNQEPPPPGIGARSQTFIGSLAGFSESGLPLVEFAANPTEEAISARSVCPLSKKDVERQVVIVLENGNSQKPIILGLLQPELSRTETTPREPVNVNVDGEVITFNARNEIVLRCGKASITLTRAGKILIRGAYLLSRSSGVNRIKGGSVQIN